MAHVKLILSEDVPSLGDAGELVSVRPGYARNFLLPQGKAMLATDERMREVEHHKRIVAERMARVRKGHEAERDRLQSIQLETREQAGEGGKLFGSVTTARIAELLAEKGVQVDRRKIALDEPIRSVGDHLIPIRLHREITANIKLKVIAAE